MAAIVEFTITAQRKEERRRRDGQRIEGARRARVKRIAAQVLVLVFDRRLTRIGRTLGSRGCRCFYLPTRYSCRMTPATRPCTATIYVYYILYLLIPCSLATSLLLPRRILASPALSATRLSYHLDRLDAFRRPRRFELYRDERLSIAIVQTTETTALRIRFGAEANKSTPRLVAKSFGTNK